MYLVLRLLSYILHDIPFNTPSHAFCQYVTFLTVTIASLTGHKRGVWKVAFSPVDKCLASSSADRTVRLWSMADHTCLKVFEGHTASVLTVRFINKGNNIHLLSLSTHFYNVFCAIYYIYPPYTYPRASVLYICVARYAVDIRVIRWSYSIVDHQIR